MEPFELGALKLTDIALATADGMRACQIMEKYLVKTGNILISTHELISLRSSRQCDNMEMGVWAKECYGRQNQADYRW
jgi:hypothetical protein